MVRYLSVNGELGRSRESADPVGIGRPDSDDATGRRCSAPGRAMSTAKPPFLLGAYVNDPDGNNADIMARYTINEASFTALMGQAPQLLDYYVDKSHPVSNWVGNADWEAWSANQSPTSSAASGTTPVIALPMYSNAWGELSPDAQYKAIVSGADDAVYQGIVDTWAKQGFMTQIYRPGWEFNIQGPTYAGDDAQSQSDWVSAFQHIYTVLHAEAAKDGVSLSVDWNPSASNYSNVIATNLYPGNNYVDTIGVDMYGDISPFSDGTNAQGQPTYHDWDTGKEDSDLAQWIADPINRMHYWTYPAATRWSSDGSGGHAQSFLQLLHFAEAQGKPFALPETGAGGTGNDVSDDAAFPQWLALQLTAAQNAGEQIAFVNPWDSNGGNTYEFSNVSDGKPLEAAAWAQYFGVPPAAGTASAASPASALAVTTPAPVTIGAGPDTLVLSLSEDAFQGDAQVTISVDGVLAGGPQTVTATHAIGQDQTVTVLGTWGAGLHTVTVTFLNDASGGSAILDRNAYVDAATYDGTAVQGTLSLYSGGPLSLTAGTAIVPATTVLGSGADTLDLKVSEDFFQGNAQFTVSVDGKQVGGTQTAVAQHAAGQEQDFQLNGAWGAGSHTVSVNFLNDVYLQGNGDRNLYVDSARYNGTAATGGLALLSGGAQSLTVTGPAAPVASVTPATVASVGHSPAPDILLQGADGTIAAWQINGPSLVSSTIIANPGTSWTAVGMGDFDGKGGSGILFQNQNGAIATWAMNGSTLVSGATIANPGTAWHAVGIGDFYGTGQSDILLQNDDGTVNIWQTSGQTLTASTEIANPGTAWQVAGVGDFDGDGKSDILLQNKDGTLDIWGMNGATIASSTVVANPGTAWHVAGTGDVTGDGKADIVLQNTDGTVYLWQVNGGTLSASTEIADPGPSWHAISVGTDSGTGKPDIVFQNDTGEVDVWDLNGASIASSGIVANPTAHWQAGGQGGLHFINGTQGAGALAGTALADDFVFTAAQPGTHSITGFDPLHDMITLGQSAFGSYAAIQAAETVTNGSTVIALGGGGSLTIQGVLPAALTAHNFN